MSKIKSILKIIAKTILWMVVGLILLFLILMLLIQLPPVQNKIIKVATSIVSDKTHTQVQLKHINIAFPHSLELEGIFLEDLQHDTLISAEKVLVDISMLKLFNNQIELSQVTLENASGKLRRSENDSLFNFNFLITAFSDSTKKEDTPTTSPSKWTFSIGEVQLKNITFLYDDKFSNINVHTNIASTVLKMNKIDLEQMRFDIDDFTVNRLYGRVEMGKSNKKNDNNEKSTHLPIITAHSIRILQSYIVYNDTSSNLFIEGKVNDFQLEDGKVDIEHELVVLNKVALSNSTIKYISTALASTKETTVSQPTESTQNWKVKVKDIRLKENSLTYKSGNEQKIKKSFDPNNLIYSHLNLIAANLYYSSSLTKVVLKQFSAQDQNNFNISKFSTDFKMEKNAITVSKLTVMANKSKINADAIIRYSSLSTIANSIGNMGLELKMKDVSVNNADILYFVPQLNSLEFFKKTKINTRFSGFVNGEIKNLKGKNIIIATASSTRLTTNFSIKGLPNVSSAIFDFPNLTISTGNKDIQDIAGSYIPHSIALPQSLKLIADFKGKIKDFKTTIGLKSSIGNALISAKLDQNEHFNSTFNVVGFDLGSLLRDKATFGKMTLNGQVVGNGLDPKVLKANLQANIVSAEFKKYNYQDVHINGAVADREFKGNASSTDPNIAFNFDGYVNFNSNNETYKFNLDLRSLNLNRLHLYDNDLTISLKANSNITGATLNKLNGKLLIEDLFVQNGPQKFNLDSISLVSHNEENKSELLLKSDLMDLKYAGTKAITEIPALITEFINKYYTISTPITKKQITPKVDGACTIEIQLKNHPILSKVFLPQLEKFEPGLIKGSFDSRNNVLSIDGDIHKMLYGSTSIDNFGLKIVSDSMAINYKLTSDKITNSAIKLDNVLFDGKLSANKVFANLSSIDTLNVKKFVVKSVLTKMNEQYKLVLNPDEFYLMNEQWHIATDNYFAFSDKGYIIHNLNFNQNERQVNINSVNEKVKDDIDINIQHLDLAKLSQIIEKDSSLLMGELNGDVLLKYINNSFGIIANAGITALKFKKIPIGDLTLDAKNPTSERFDVNLSLTGFDNKLNANGYFIPDSAHNSIYVKSDIQSLSMKTVEAFSMGQIKNASGFISGNFLLQGKTSNPDLIGNLVFNNVLLNPVYLNNMLELKHETIALKSDGIYFDAFTVLDSKKNAASLNGSIKVNPQTVADFSLHVDAKNFLLFNTTQKDNDLFYGKMIIDTKIDVTGPISLPVLNAKIKLDNGSNLCFIVPDSKLSNYKGEDVVEFTNKDTLVNALKAKQTTQKSSFSGFDLSSIIEVDNNATLKLLMDPMSSDSLVVKGNATLGFSMDRSGKMSLTGAYHVNSGSYEITLQSVIKRKFEILNGSTITWNGDPLDANISMNASYSTRATPYDLVADQIGGLSDADKAGYKQMYPFLVILKMRGALLQPEIGFEIQLPPEEKGILGGAVNQKLKMLDEDASELNKQVFSMLLLSRFLQQDPLKTESNITSLFVRSTVGNFISNELNKLSSKVVPGVELSFDVQSFEDYQTGRAQGRTQVDIGVKKQLFNDRLSVQLGSSVNLEGKTSVSDIVSDVTVEYKLTEDGRYRLKGFRHNVYEGVIDGELVETGLGAVYVRDFNLWSDFFGTNKKSTKK